VVVQTPSCEVRGMRGPSWCTKSVVRGPCPSWRLSRRLLENRHLRMGPQTEFSGSFVRRSADWAANRTLDEAGQVALQSASSCRPDLSWLQEEGNVTWHRETVGRA